MSVLHNYASSESLVGLGFLCILLDDKSFEFTGQ